MMWYMVEVIGCWIGMVSAGIARQAYTGFYSIYASCMDFLNLCTKNVYVWYQQSKQVDACWYHTKLILDHQPLLKLKKKKKSPKQKINMLL